MSVQDAPASAGIVVAEPSLLVATCLSEVLTGYGHEMRTPVTTASELRAALAREEGPPLLVLLGGGLGRDGSVAALVQEVTESGAGCLVLLAGPSRDTLLDLLEGGALGVVAADVDAVQLRRTVEAAARGEACIPRGALSSVLRELIDRRRRDDAVHRCYQRLSRREREVLALLAAGSSTDVIAKQLVLSPATVRTHLGNLMGKLEVRSQVDAVTLVHKHRLAEPRRSA